MVHLAVHRRALAGDRFLLVYFLPATVYLVSWLAQVVLAAQVSTLEFWAALLFAVIVLSPYVLRPRRGDPRLCPPPRSMARLV